MQHCWQHDVNHPCCESAFPLSVFYVLKYTHKTVIHWSY